MKGSVLMGSTLAVAAAMGIGLWYSINSAYYYDVTDITEVQVEGVAVSVRNYRGIDADTSPLKIRACFNLDRPFVTDTTYQDAAVPLTPPSGFDCFDARKIGADLKSGIATAILSQANAPYGFNTFIAHYPDGQAFLWRQINDCGDAVFSGDTPPSGCPSPNQAANQASANESVLLFPVVGGKAENLPVQNMQASGQGAAFHACFEVTASLGFLSESYVLVEEALPTAYLTAGLRVPKGNPLGLKSLDDLRDRKDLRIVLANPGAASVGNSPKNY